MAGYTDRAVGTAGTMRIYDNGSNGVEFLIACGDPATHIGSYTWSGVVNGVGVGGTVNLPAGFGQRSLGSWTVTSSQTVSWHQNATGTQGLGGAADISAYVNRSTIPSAPGTPTASNIQTNQVTINWNLPYNGGAGLDQMLLRANESSPVDQGGYWNVAVLGGNVTSYTVTGLSPATDLWYCVYAHNGNGYSPKSGDVLVATLPVAPSAPTFSGVGSTSMTVSWTRGDNGDAVSGYDLQYDTTSSFSSPVTVSQSGTSKALSGLTEGELYYFRVRAKTASGTGAWTATVSQATGLAAPTGLTISSVTPTSLVLSWYDVPGASSFEIQYSTSSTFSGATTVTSSVTNRTLTGLTPATGYYLRVRAKSTDVTGPWSATATTASPPATAPGLTVTATASGRGATAAMTPPSGATGVTQYTVEYRLGATGAITSGTTPSSTLTVTGLTPGATYQWRAAAWFDDYQSPFTGWTSVTQPNPNTNPGQYFDGATAARGDVTFAWTGTANNSTSTANGVGVDGWESFVGAGVGATVRLQRITGGRSGSYAARGLIVTDAAAAGVTVGMTGASTGGAKRAVVEEGATYVGSLYVRPSRAQRLFAEMVWYNDAGTEVPPRPSATATLVSDTVGWTRLTVAAIAPVGATTALVRVRDTAGSGWSPWLSGEWFDVDDAMVTLSSLFDWFSGDTPDSADYDYAWLGPVNASVSTRTTVVDADYDPLADPDCDPLPQPPRPPTVPADCIVEVGIWRRYWLSVPASEVGGWEVTIPTVYLRTGPEPTNQVRIRMYPNPFGYTPDQLDLSQYCSEQIVSYIPPNSRMHIDGITQRAWCHVHDGPPISADHLLYGTGGTPPTWPELSCGISYLFSFDVPLDAAAGNITPSVDLTERV